MMEKTITMQFLSDKAILQQIGAFVKRVRLQQNVTQQHAAVAAGINRSTWVQLENGGGATLLSFIQALRALNRLDVLAGLEPAAPSISPLQLARLEQRQRRRARGSREQKAAAEGRTGQSGSTKPAFHKK